MSKSIDERVIAKLLDIIEEEKSLRDRAVARITDAENTCKKLISENERLQKSIRKCTPKKDDSLLNSLRCQLSEANDRLNENAITLGVYIKGNSLIIAIDNQAIGFAIDRPESGWLRAPTLPIVTSDSDYKCFGIRNIVKGQDPFYRIENY